MIAAQLERVTRAAALVQAAIGHCAQLDGLVTLLGSTGCDPLLPTLATGARRMLPTALAPAMAGAAVTARARMINAQATAAMVEVVLRCVTFCAASKLNSLLHPCGASVCAPSSSATLLCTAR
jgi:hypothetical protein